MKKNDKINKYDLEASNIEVDDKLKMLQKPYDLKNLFTSNKSNEKENMSYEKSLSLALLTVIDNLDKSSEISKKESMYIAMLSSCSKTLEKVLTLYVENKRHFKRKRVSEWLSTIKNITTAINRKEKESEGLLSDILHRNR